MDATISVRQIEAGSSPLARLASLALAEIREQWYWFVWLAVIALDLYSARQTQLQPWLLSHYVWWVAPFVLWFTMPRRMRWPNSGLAALLVFTWIAYSLDDFAFGNLILWFPNNFVAPLASLSILLQFALTSAVIALALAHSTVRVFGQRAVVATVAVGLAAGFSLHGQAILEWSRWIERPFSINLRLFGVGIVPLVYAAGVQRLLLARAHPAWIQEPPTGTTLPPKAWFVGFPGAMICALMLIAGGALLAVQFEDLGAAFIWTILVGSGLGALALVSWAGTHALHRALHDVRRPGYFHRVRASTRIVVIWTGLLAIWLPMAYLTWTVRGAELEQLLQGANGPLWTVTVSPDKSTLVVDGAIAAGLGKDIQTQLDKHPAIKVLELTSGGGKIAEAYDIAELVRDKHLVTLVRDHCESACTFIFAAGTQRLLGEEGSLGYHDENEYGLPTGRALEEKLVPLRRYGIDESFQEKGLHVPHWDIWYPEKDELLKSGAITKVGTTADLDEDKTFRVGSWLIDEPDRDGDFHASVVGPEGGFISQSCMAEMERCSWFVNVDVPCRGLAADAVRVSTRSESVSLAVNCKVIDGTSYWTFKDFDQFEDLVANGASMAIAIPRIGAHDLVLNFNLAGAQEALAYMHKTSARLMPKVAM